MNRVQLFEWVRDIPYKIATNVKNADCCCLTKPAILQLLLKAIGLKSRHVICLFRWSQTGLPKKLFERSIRDEETHGYLEVFIPEGKKWVAVDPTWDKTLEGSIFPIAHWDGKTSTRLAVKPIKTFSYKESLKIVKEWDACSLKKKQKQIDENKIFFNEFNKYISHLRLKIAKYNPIP